MFVIDTRALSELARGSVAPIECCDDNRYILWVRTGSTTGLADRLRRRRIELG